ncbi:phage integrase central domain-containing protein [Affinibrenneria salicis]|uniref:phage integrase central domain-containing protein n=1 Tax=Affinibrenneria salicis TaxID=2590031 RepID=UPI0037BEA1D1
MDKYRLLTHKAGRQTSLTQRQRIFGSDVLPGIGKTAIFDVRRADLLQILGMVERRGALTVAEKIRSWLNQIFRFALVIVEGLENNPASFTRG